MDVYVGQLSLCQFLSNRCLMQKPPFLALGLGESMRSRTSSLRVRSKVPAGMDRLPAIDLEVVNERAARLQRRKSTVVPRRRCNAAKPKDLDF